MKRFLRKYRLVLFEVGLFAVTIGVLSIDEFVGIPLLFPGISMEQHKWTEFAIEASLVSIMCLIFVAVTLLLQRRLRRAESFLRICGWCKKVSNEGTWVPFEEYMAQKYQELSTHGICDSCKERMLEEARKRHSAA